jgi:glycolate oxidase FAD binding subunit
VAYRRDQLGKVLGRPIGVMAAKRSAATWRTIRDGTMFAGNDHHPLWRISVAPSAAPDMIRMLRNTLEIRYLFDWAGGLVWLEVPPSHDAAGALVRSSFAAGHATLIRAPEATRAAVEVFQPQAPALAALSGRVKNAFDPRHILNPGRMYRGI